MQRKGRVEAKRIGLAVLVVLGTFVNTGCVQFLAALGPILSAVGSIASVGSSLLGPKPPAPGAATASTVGATGTAPAGTVRTTVTGNPNDPAFGRVETRPAQTAAQTAAAQAAARTVAERGSGTSFLGM